MPAKKEMPRTSRARQGKGETFGGLDYYGRTKKELEALARRSGVTGASTMDKRELGRAVARKQKSRGRRAA